MLASVLLLALLMVLPAVVVRGDEAEPTGPRCSVGSDPDGQVISFTDQGLDRCLAVIAPPAPPGQKLPVLFWFHGSGGNAANCDGLPLAAIAKANGFALVCGEAFQCPPHPPAPPGCTGAGGQWAMPNVITDATGTPCGDTDSHDIGYIRSSMQRLDQLGRFDLGRIFYSGCSQGSGFSSYITACTKQNPATAGNLSAWATHSTGLKTKGDGIKWDCCSDIESCEQCKYFPFAPYEVPKTDLDGLKACIFDNAEDRLPPDPSAEPFFFLSSKELASAWRAHGNVAETHFGPGGHCQIHSFYAIAKCLDDGTGRLCSEKGCTNETAIV